MGHRDRPPASSGLEQRLWLALMVVAGAWLALWLLRLVLPWLVLGGVGSLGYWLWQRRRQQDKALHRLFYDLLQQRGGYISVLDFAIAAQLTGSEARTFLDARAQEFYANFEPTDQGDILYAFVTAQSPAQTQAQSPGTGLTVSPEVEER